MKLSVSDKIRPIIEYNLAKVLYCYLKTKYKVGIGIGISDNNIAHVCARFWPAGNNCGTFAHNVPNWRWPEINRGHGDRLKLNKDMNFIKTAGK